MHLRNLHTTDISGLDGLSLILELEDTLVYQEFVGQTISCSATFLRMSLLPCGSHF